MYVWLLAAVVFVCLVTGRQYGDVSSDGSRQSRRRSAALLARRTTKVFLGIAVPRCDVNMAEIFFEKLEMWANAQRDGRPAEHRWRPLFNAAKFG